MQAKNKNKTEELKANGVKKSWKTALHTHAINLCRQRSPSGPPVSFSSVALVGRFSASESMRHSSTCMPHRENTMPHWSWQKGDHYTSSSMQFGKCNCAVHTIYRYT